MTVPLHRNTEQWQALILSTEEQGIKAWNYLATQSSQTVRRALVCLMLLLSHGVALRPQPTVGLLGRDGSGPGRPPRLSHRRSSGALCLSYDGRPWLRPLQKRQSGDDHLRVPGEIKRSRDLRGGRWSWTLTFAQKRSWVGRWSWAEQVGPASFASSCPVVHQQRCNGLTLS